MRRRLFLTGPAETGKSEMIQKVLGDRIGQAGGFITVRERDEKGNVRSYSLVAADGSGQQGNFLEIIDGKSVTHLEVFSQLGATLVQRAQNKPFAVLDELGGAELLDDSFMEALVRLIKSKTPCIGVVKRYAPGGRTVGGMGLSVRYELARKVLQEYISRDSDTMLVETSGMDDAEIMALIQQWVDEYANG